MRAKPLLALAAAILVAATLLRWVGSGAFESRARADVQGAELTSAAVGAEGDESRRSSAFGKVRSALSAGPSEGALGDGEAPVLPGPTPLHRERVLVRVLDDEGVVPAAEVRVWSEEGLFVNGLLTDARGECTVELEPERTLEAVEGRRSSGLLQRALEQLDPGAPLELRLREPVPVTGRVVDPEGVGIPGATVSFFRKGFVIGGTAPRLPEELRTDEEGRFRSEVDGVPGRIWALARRGQALSDPVQLMTPAVAEVVLTMHPPEGIDVSVLDARGSPLRGGRLLLRAQGGGETASRPLVDGRAFVPLSGSGPWLLRVEQEAPPPGPIVPLSRAQGIPGSLELRLREPSTLAGRVLDGDGHGMRDVALVAVPDPASLEALGLPAGTSVESGVTRTDEEGRFRIDDLWPYAERWSILGYAPEETGFGDFRRDGIPAGARDSSISLDPRTEGRPRVRVRVLDEQGAELQGTCRIVVHRRDATGAWRSIAGPLAEQCAGPLQVATIRAPGEYALGVIGPAGFLAGLAGPLRLEAGEHEIEVRLPRPRELILHAPPSRFLVGASLAKSSLHPSAPQQVIARGPTRGSTIRFLVAPGEHLLERMLDDGSSIEMELEIAGAEVNEVWLEASSGR